MSRDELDQAGAAMAERIVTAVAGFPVEDGEQWLALTQNMLGVSYYATDLDPRSFEKDEARGTWLGRAELLLKAPGRLRPGQAVQDVSFTMPVRVLLSEQDGEFFITGFDFYFAEENAGPLPESLTDLDIGPPKSIGWGPFEGLRKELD